MASPGPPLKKSKRLKQKFKVKEEDDIAHASPADAREGGDGRRGRKMSQRAAAGRSGPDNGATEKVPR